MGKTTVLVAPEMLAAFLLPGSHGNVLGAEYDRAGPLRLLVESPLLADAPTTVIRYATAPDGKIFIASIFPDFSEPTEQGRAVEAAGHE
jgi:hypothetical protein